MTVEGVVEMLLDATRNYSDRREYYIQLESSQRGSLDITSWLAWFLNCIGNAIDNADEMLSEVIYKSKL